MGFNLLVRPAVEFHDEIDCQGTSSRQHHQEGQQEQEQERGRNNVVSPPNLKIKIPSYDLQADESNGDGCKTPTSSDQIIPSSPPCPPAPKKPKPIPSRRKRKSCVVTRTILDLSREIEYLFPAPLLLDLYGKIKKVRAGN